MQPTSSHHDGCARVATPKRLADMLHVPWEASHACHRATALIVVTLYLFPGSVLGIETRHELDHGARAWLEFNHHVGGILVLTLAALTWLELLEVGPAKVIKLSWPGCLILIGGYNLIWSDKLAWPIRPSGLVESLSNSDVLQHKMLAFLVLTLGLIDLLRRLMQATHPAWLYLFYGMSMLTAGTLVVHDSSLSSNMHSTGVAMSHVVMGSLAMLALGCKVLVDHRLIAGRVAYLYPLLLTALGVQLLLFTEPSEMER